MCVCVCVCVYNIIHVYVFVLLVCSHQSLFDSLSFSLSQNIVL